MEFGIGKIPLLKNLNIKMVGSIFVMLSLWLGSVIFYIKTLPSDSSAKSLGNDAAEIEASGGAKKHKIRISLITCDKERFVE